jgi:hypothetical protein
MTTTASWCVDQMIVREGWLNALTMPKGSGCVNPQLTIATEKGIISASET